MMKEPSGLQIKAARVLLGWSKAELSKMADVSVATIARVERKTDRIGGRLSTATKLVLTLKKAGIEFGDVSDRCQGVLFVAERKAGD